MATSAGWDGTLDAIFDDTDCKQQDSEIGRFTLAFTGTGNPSLERSSWFNMHAWIYECQQNSERKNWFWAILFDRSGK